MLQRELSNDLGPRCGENWAEMDAEYWCHTWTSFGKLHAQAAAERILDEPFRVFMSPIRSTMQKRGFCGAASGQHWSLAARNNYFFKAHWRSAQLTSDFAVLHDWITVRDKRSVVECCVCSSPFYQPHVLFSEKHDQNRHTGKSAASSAVQHANCSVRDGCYL